MLERAAYQAYLYTSELLTGPFKNEYLEITFEVIFEIPQLIYTYVFVISNNTAQTVCSVWISAFLFWVIKKKQKNEAGN